MKKLKSPSFNFYPESFLSGVRKMSDKEVGIYIRALCYQFNEGLIEDDEYMTFPEKVKSKFIKTDGGWINERLEFERKKKADYVASRQRNLESKPLEERLKEAGVIK